MIFSQKYSICSGSNLLIYFLLRFELLVLFKFSSFPLLKKRQIQLLKRKCKVHKKRDKVRKWILIIRFLSEIKNLPIDLVFSNWINFIKKSIKHKLYLIF